METIKRKKIYIHESCAVLILPMRNGNGIRIDRIGWINGVLILPMRNGNQKHLKHHG